MHATDILLRKAQKRDELMMGERERVCGACVKASDFVLGWVHSELNCERCGKRPCAGAIVLL